MAKLQLLPNFLVNNVKLQLGYSMNSPHETVKMVCTDAFSSVHFFAALGYIILGDRRAKGYEMRNIPVPRPISGGLMLSYQCSASCRHCMYACSPKWEADWIKTDDLTYGLSKLSASIEPSPWGGQSVSLNHGLHITGGEPFLNFELLLGAVEITERFQIPSTFVETNCFWCVNDDQTRRKLNLLKEAGLKGILISVNPYYAEYVPFERTERCVSISEEVFGYNVMVYQTEYYQLFRRLGLKERISLDDYLKLTRGENLAKRVELFLLGRAAWQLQGFYPKYSATRFFQVPCHPPILRPWHNHFDNYGNLMPGYCGGISLGSWFEIDRLTREGIDPEKNPILGFLLAGDIAGLIHFAADLGYQEVEEGYISKCHLCLDIRKHLVAVSDFAELSPKEFYSHLE
jgi:hypothetical protein